MSLVLPGLRGSSKNAILDNPERGIVRFGRDAFS
jgi:hypothetical protein